MGLPLHMTSLAGFRLHTPLGSVVSHLNKDSDRPVADLRFLSTIISCNTVAFLQKCLVFSQNLPNRLIFMFCSPKICCQTLPTVEIHLHVMMAQGNTTKHITTVADCLSQSAINILTEGLS